MLLQMQPQKNNSTCSFSHMYVRVSMFLHLGFNISPRATIIIIISCKHFAQHFFQLQMRLQYCESQVTLFSHSLSIVCLFNFIFSCTFVGLQSACLAFRNNLSGKSNKWEQFWRLFSCDNLTRTSAKICKISYKTLRPARPGLIFAVFQINMRQRMKGVRPVSLPSAWLDLFTQDGFHSGEIH